MVHVYVSTVRIPGFWMRTHRCLLQFPSEEDGQQVFDLLRKFSSAKRYG